MRGISKIVPTSPRTSFEQLPETSVFNFIFFRLVSASTFLFFSIFLSKFSSNLVKSFGSDLVEMMDSVYPEPLSRLHRRAVRKKFHKNSARYRTQPVTFAEIQEVDEDQVNEDAQSTGSASKSELDLKAKFEEFKRQRDKDLLEIRLTTNGVDNENNSESNGYERTTNSKENENREARSLLSILPYRGSSSCPRTSV